MVSAEISELVPDEEFKAPLPEGLDPVLLADLPSSELEALGILQRTPRPVCTSCGRPLKTAGLKVGRWLERHCTFTKARWAGTPMRLVRTQKEVLAQLFALNCSCGRDVGPPGTRRYRWALIEVAKKAGLPGKTELMAGLGHYLLLADGEPDPLIVVGAGSDEQADLLFGAAKTMHDLSRPLQVDEVKQVREISLRAGLGSMKRVSAATGTNDGPNISAALLDELHVWTGKKGRDTWTVLTNGGVVREQPLVAQISTAGFDRQTVMWEQHQQGRQTVLDWREDPRFFFYYRAAPVNWPLDHPLTWAAANAGYGSITDDAFYLDQLKRKSEGDFRRYFANQWTRSQDSWLPPGSWEQGRDPITLVRHAPTWLAIDLALYHDSAAVTIGQEHQGKYHVRCRVFPPRNGKVDLVEVKAYLRQLQTEYQLQEASYDPRYLELTAQELTDEGFPMVEIPQHPSVMTPICQTAYELIVSGRVVHGGDPTLEEHVMRATRRETEQGWTLSKGKSPGHIDGCISTVICLARMALARPPSSDGDPFHIW